MLAEQVMTIARDETGNATVPTTAKIVISALITMMVVAVAPWTTIGSTEDLELLLYKTAQRTTPTIRG